MIYLKRFCFAIVNVLAILLMVISIILLVITFPFAGLIYYIFTGKDPVVDADLFAVPVDITTSFLDWYKKKLGPKDT